MYKGTVVYGTGPEGRWDRVTVEWTPAGYRLVYRIEGPEEIVLYSPWVGVWYPTRPQEERWEEGMSFLKAKREEAKIRIDETSQTHLQLRKQWPALMEYLEASAYPDGASRQTATLIMLVEEERWKACLNDRDTSRSLWVTGDSPTACLEALDAILQGGEPEWRGSGPQRGKGRQKGR